MSKLSARISLSVIGAILVALTIVSCGAGVTHFSEYHNLPNAGWKYSDTLKYRVRIPDMSGYGQLPDTADIGTLSVAIRHDGYYPYRSISLEVTYPEEGVLRRDTVSMRLADNYGRWVGIGFGDSYQTEAIVATGLSLKDSSQVTVRHIMRVDTIPGINQVGIFFIANERQ